MKTIVIIIPFEKVYPPVSGGMLRCFNLLRQLSRNFRVLAITFQEADSFRPAVKDFPELKNCEIRTAVSLKIAGHPAARFVARVGDALRYRWMNRSLNGSANSNFLRIYPSLMTIMKTEKPTAVIFEEMSVIALSNPVRRHSPDTKVVYDAHNVNLTLAKSAFELGQISAAEYQLAEAAEKNIWTFTPRIFACSQNDLDTIIHLNAGKLSGIVVPNGVTLKPYHKKSNLNNQSRPQIFFCGSLDYPPNREGLSWFCREIFPAILAERPLVELQVVGQGDPGESLTRLLQHPQIKNHGFVKDLTSFYDAATIAIVPLLSGSGTRLKLLEAMSFAVPVVSTAIGAEGIGYADETDILIGDTSMSFAQQVLRLLGDEKTCNRIAESALDLVRSSYDWNRIGDSMNRYLAQLTGAGLNPEIKN